MVAHNVKILIPLAIIVIIILALAGCAAQEGKGLENASPQAQAGAAAQPSTQPAVQQPAAQPPAEPSPASAQQENASSPSQPAPQENAQATGCSIDSDCLAGSACFAEWRSQVISQSGVFLWIVNPGDLKCHPLCLLDSECPAGLECIQTMAVGENGIVLKSMCLPANSTKGYGA